MNQSRNKQGVESPAARDADVERNGNRKVVINISGQQFVTTVKTLLNYPHTRLGRLVTEEPTVSCHFFESDTEIFKEVLKFYNKRKLHCPKNVCFTDFREHLEYWEISVKNVSECCAKAAIEEEALERQFDYFNRRIPLSEDRSKCCPVWQRNSIWCFLTDPYGADTKYKLLSKVWMVFYLVITVFSGMVLSVETLPFVRNYAVTNSSRNLSLSGTMIPSCEKLFSETPVSTLEQIEIIDLALVIFFTIEIWMRFCSCPNKVMFWKSINGLDMIISLCECLAYLYMVYLRVKVKSFASYSHGTTHCISAKYINEFLLVLGQLRFLRLLSYATVYSGLKVLLIALYRSRREFLLLVILLGIAVLVFGPLVYFMTTAINPEEKRIVSIPIAYWFVVVTMTTVGYGDMYPTTFPGYIATVIVMIVGLTITALPIAIVGGNFALVYEYNQKREEDSKAKENEIESDHEMATLS